MSDAAPQRGKGDLLPEQGQSGILLQQSRSGDGEALDQLLAAHLPSLRAFLRLRVNPELRARESATDLAQSVCADILARAHDFEYRGEASFKAWLFTTALNKVIDKYRFHRAERRDVRKEAHADGMAQTYAEGMLERAYASLATASQVAIAKEEVQQLERAFDELPDNYRELITLQRIAGLSYQEIAERMGISETQVRGQLYRALLKLGEVMERLDGGGS